MPSISIFAVAIISVFMLSGCRSEERLPYTANIRAEPHEGTSGNAKTSSIIGSEEKQWRGNLMNIGESGEFLSSLQLTGDNVIYFLGDKNGVFRSNDGGVTWNSKKFEIPPNALVSSLFFIDSSEGYASVVSSATDVMDESGFRSWILKTSGGGDSWQHETYVDAAEIHKIVFDKRHVGWAVGRKLVRSDHLTDQALILTKTSGGGWQKLSVPEQLGFIRNIYVEDNLTKTFIDTQGKTMQLDSESDWKSFFGINDIKQPQIQISTIAVTKEDDFYLMGSTGGREGAWTSLFTRGNTSQAWQHFDLNNVILRDAIFFSSGEILACGSTSSDEVTGPAPSTAIILHSLDRGRSWLLSYKTYQTEFFNELVALNENTILAIGKGKLLRLERVP